MSLTWIPNMFKYTAVYCPVGEHKKLGEIVKGQISSLACIECGFLFTWDTEGHLLAPLQITKAVKKGCNCESCKYRDSQKESK